MIRFLVALIMYKVSPIKMGTLALHTYVNKQSGRRMGVPLPALKRVAEEAYQIVRITTDTERRLSRQKKPGLLDEVASYSNQLDYFAAAIIQILTREIDPETAQIRHPRIVEILKTTPWIPGASLQ